MPIFLPLLTHFDDRPDLLRHPGRAQPADLVPDARRWRCRPSTSRASRRRTSADGRSSAAACRSCAWSSWRWSLVYVFPRHRDVAAELSLRQLSAWHPVATASNRPRREPLQRPSIAARQGHGAMELTEACLDADRRATSRRSRRGPSSTPSMRCGQARAARRAHARRPAARAAARRCRSASRTSSTPPTCRPRTARVLHAGRRPLARCDRRRAAARGRRRHARQDGDHRVRLLHARQDPQPARPRAHAGRLLQRLGRRGRRGHGAAGDRHARPTAR